MKEQYSTPVKQSKHTYFSRLLSLDLGGKKHRDAAAGEMCDGTGVRDGLARGRVSYELHQKVV